MSTVEGSYRTGWFILLTADETKRIADRIGDYTAPIAAASAFIPEPIVTKIIGVGTAVLVVLAKKAVQRGKALGVYISLNPVPRFSHMRYLKVSDLYRFMYMRNAALGWLPFLYDGNDPESLASWRRAVGI